ncbi:ABC transporter permease [Rhodoferax aquaticus]|uniref:ABC transporter permease n=2 Tax=Rhodoferax aquaticus TaxID=2527691 RepID=A0A515EVV0_9BURK|nr:ABC transporter permease [Rhodoferax aquaticus]
MRKARKRFMRHRLALLGLVILTLMLAAAVFAPLIERYPPNDLNLEAMGQAPSAAHWLGTDTTGRDVWSRVIHASQVSMSVGLVAVSLSTLIGVLIGSVSGYASGRTDLLLMRMTDMVMAFPSMVIIITVAAALGPSIYNTMLVIGMLTWPGVARLVRGQMLSFREQQFVLAARSIGVPPIQIMYRHLLPNVVGTVTVAATFGMANAILQEAALSFLGLGVQAPTPSWGNMLRDAQTLSILEGMPWLWIVPGLMIALAVLSINFIGDGLRDALDPRSVL